MGAIEDGAVTPGVLPFPARIRPTPPMRRAQIRTVAGLVATWVVGGVLVLTTSSGWHLVGLGLFLPGAGFGPTGAGWLFPVLFALALVMAGIWFALGPVLVLPLVWLGGALLAGLLYPGGVANTASADLWTPSVAIGLLVLSLIGRAIYAGWAPRKLRERNERLAVFTLPDVPASPAIREMGEEDLAVQRFLLDLSLQPLERFDGFVTIDQIRDAAWRYQCFFTGWALALATQNHTPAFTGYTAEAQRSMILKVRDKRVWNYWFWENLWGNLRWEHDPMRTDNIMLTGYYGLQIGAYEATTGDRSFSEPGALEFRDDEDTVYAYDYPTIMGRWRQNMLRHGVGAYPCEPHFTYGICNQIGVAAAMMHDRMHGTDHLGDLYDTYLASMTQDLTSRDGRQVAIRCSLLGLVPGALTRAAASEAASAMFLSPTAPALGERTWAVLRSEFIDVHDDGAARVRLRPFDRIDVGDYRFRPTYAYAAISEAAAEYGDDEVVRGLRTWWDEHYPLQYREGAARFPASVGANAFMAMARFNGGHGWRRLVREAPTPDVAPTGPRLVSAPYPDALVARAVADGGALHLVVRPGGDGSRVTLGLDRLVPGREHRVEGALEDTVTADATGAARLQVDLDGRRAVTVAPLP